MSHSHPLPTVPPLAAGQSRRHGYADGMKRTEDSANSSAGRRGRGTPSKRPGWLALPCSRSISFGGYVSRLPLTTHPPTHPTDHAHESKQQPSVAYARATPAPARHRAKKGKETISASVPARPQCGALPAECRPRAYKIRSTRPSDSPPTQAEEHTHTHPRPLRPRCSRVAGPDRDEARSAALGSPRAR